MQREISQREAELEEEQWLEDEASQPLPEDVAADLEDQHRAHVAQQAAQAAAEARRADQIADALIAEQEPRELFVKRAIGTTSKFTEPSSDQPNPFSPRTTPALMNASAKPTAKVRHHPPQ